MGGSILKKNNGLSIIELIVALALTGVMTAALYRTFILQQNIFAVQEQIVEMQQSARVSVEQMTAEIRMAGFGNVKDVLILTGGVNGFTNIVTPSANTITVVGAFQQVRGSNGVPIYVTAVSGTQITLSQATNVFDGSTNKFISIGGISSYTVIQPTGTTTVLTLNKTPTYPVGLYIYKIYAITYNTATVNGTPVLQKNMNTGAGAIIVADNIEAIQFKYYDAGNPPVETATPSNIKMIWVKVSGKTKTADFTYKNNGGFRKTTIALDIKPRNL